MNDIHIQSINQKAFWNFDRYRLDNVLIDCSLISNDEIYPCHRIVLASKSQYFYEYFKSKLDTEIKLPINPENFFTKILDFIYKGSININSRNIAVVCKFSEFYKISSLENLIQQQFKNIISINNCLGISKSLRDNDIHTKDIQIAEIIYKDILKNKVDDIHKIYSSVSPNVLSKILAKFQSVIEDDQKINIIENYLMSQKTLFLKEIDKEALASVIDWSNADSYKYIICYKCEWLPSKLIKPRINTILNLRRDLIHKANNVFKSASKGISKFYPLIKICEINNLESVEKNDYDVTHFLSTVGNLSKKINILKYGFIQVKTSTYLPDFAPQFIFDQNDNSNYFLSIGDDLNHPFLTFSFGEKANFLLTQIEIQTSRLQNEQYQTYLPYKLQIECFDCDENSPLEKIELNNSKELSITKVSLKKYYKFYRIIMNESDPVHSWVFRLIQIKINGKFVFD